MKRVKGTTGLTQLECINPNKNRWSIRFDIQPNEEDSAAGVNYWEETLDHEPTLLEVKAIVSQGVDSYDASDEISDFSIGGVSMWLDKTARTGLALTITTLLSNIEATIRNSSTELSEAEILAAIESQTANESVRLWSLTTPPVSFDLPVLQMQMALGTLETYAKATYD